MQSHGVEPVDAGIHLILMSSPENTSIESPLLADPTAPRIRFGFANTYSHLPARFYARVEPIPVAAPRLIKVNEQLARFLGLEPGELASEEGVEILAGNLVARGSEPLALAYAGHQFGYFVPQLGDGRAKLLGEVLARDGERYDVQLKGSGRTPFSRRGDGRAALGPVLREYVVSEAMAALGVPTTRALAAVTTGQPVFREVALPGAVLVRVAASHLRVGTFQYFAAQGDPGAMRTLADYAMARHYPAAAQAKKPIRTLLDGVIARQADLIAQWMLLGFIHGVMNTDNMSIAGETIDYGPCAFVEAYDPAMVYSSIDHHGRYAYNNQSPAALWNLTRLAETLLPLLEEEEGSAEGAMRSASEALEAFEPQFEEIRAGGLRRKLGLMTEQPGDMALAEELLGLMAANSADYTLTFRRLGQAAAGPHGDDAVRVLFTHPEAYAQWAVRWRERLKAEPVSEEHRASAMRMANPAIIPRNHLVAAVIDAAVEREDFAPFEELLVAVSRPYEDGLGSERYATPALPEERVVQTFCGT